MGALLSLLLSVAHAAPSFSDLSLEFQVSADVFEGEAHELLFHQAVSSPVPSPVRDQGKEWMETTVMLGTRTFSCVIESAPPKTLSPAFREMLLDPAARDAQLAAVASLLLKETAGPCLLNVRLSDVQDPLSLIILYYRKTRMTFGTLSSVLASL